MAANTKADFNPMEILRLIFCVFIIIYFNYSQWEFLNCHI